VRQLVPNAAMVALLVNPTNVNAKPDTADMQTAARAAGHELLIVEATTDHELHSAFASLVSRRVSVLILGADAYFNHRRSLIASLAARHAIPTIYEFRESVAAGGLMSYGASLADYYTKAGVYTGRILRGAKPADLPVMQPTRFELVINLKTAKALGLEVPPTLLVRADEVIE